MYNFLVKKGTTVSFIVGLLVIIIFLATAFSGLGSDGYDASTDLVSIAKNTMASDEAAGNLGTSGYESLNFFNSGIALTLGLAFLAVGAMVLFFFIGIIKFPKEGMRTIATFVGLIILFFILKAIAPADVGEKMAEIRDEFNVTDGVSSVIGGGIMTTLCLIAVAAVSMVFFEIRNAFK